MLVPHWIASVGGLKKLPQGPKKGRRRNVANMGDNRITIIGPAGQEHYWLELWRYRELFLILAWRDLAVRYKQTAIGVMWALIRPLFGLLIFTIIFGRVAGLPSEGSAPYALMVFAGMLPWTFFSTGLVEASYSLANNANLLSKVYMPWLIVPTATIVVALVEFLIGFCILLALLVWYQFLPGWQIVLLPAFVIFLFIATVGPSLWSTALNVRYRDFRYVVPFLVQFGLYVSPVGFTSSIVPEHWRVFYSINPMVGIIDGFRWCILGSEPYLPGLAMSASAAGFFLWLGIRQFRKVENSFADLL
jgi:lipopolysaccharide transport system permease protein